MINQVIGENEEFEGTTVALFFEAFLTKMPQWWKDTNFNMKAIVTHFNKIFTQIITARDNGRAGEKSKPTHADVLGDLNLKNSNFNDNE